MRLLEYDADQEVLKSVAVWLHPDEVWDVAACPLATERMVTVHCKGEEAAGMTALAWVLTQPQSAW